MDSLQGHLLVASPHLPDPNFYRSVVLMVQHNDDGALGLVLNRPSQRTTGEIWVTLADEACQVDRPVNIGGPIEGPLMAVHTREDWSESQIVPGLFFSTHKDYLHQIVNQTKHPFRMFSGYSGWGAGQLENEMQVGGWLTTPARVDHLFKLCDDELWNAVAGEIGQDILSSTLGIKEIPDEPGLN